MAGFTTKKSRPVALGDLRPGDVLVTEDRRAFTVTRCDPVSKHKITVTLDNGSHETADNRTLVPAHRGYFQ